MKTPLKIYSYYGFASRTLPVARVEAESILAADEMVKALGFKLQALSCSIGIRYVCVDTNAIERRFLSAMRTNTIVRDIHYVDGDLFASVVVDNKDAAIALFNSTPREIHGGFTDVFFEYPGSNREFAKRCHTDFRRLFAQKENDSH